MTPGGRGSSGLPDPEALVGSLPQGLPAGLGEGTRAVVTGCAGFIGSHLSEALLGLGCEVVGVDALTDYYDPELKRENLAAALAHPRFRFLETDLLALEAAELLDGATVCFHLAAQAGVRASWGRHFEEYLARNVRSTQHLLEGCLLPAVRDRLVRFVYSSSSSVYGDQRELPVTEARLPRPHSPYGVTKLAAEHLCGLYAANHGVPAVSLRYFTVYGPRQRPDMAFRRFVESALDGREFPVFGDGSQTRDFTYVEDAVRANLLAVRDVPPGTVFNVGGGRRVSLREALAELQRLLEEARPDRPPRIVYDEVFAGDVRDTYADGARAEALVGYRPRIGFEDGLARMVSWALARRTELE
jgi:nucleoside-diphosphate-sugar epimerase